MKKPPWDFSRRGEAQMSAWLDAMLERELSLAITEANSCENIELFWREIEPVEAIIQRLRQGDADTDDQERAAQLLEKLISPTPKRRGPKTKPKIERDEYLTMAARDAVRIKELWQEHYRQADTKKAVEFACKRWINRDAYRPDEDGQYRYDCAIADLETKIHDTFRRQKSRNFGV